MTEQVERVLNPPGPGQRAAVDRHPYRFRKLLSFPFVATPSRTSATVRSNSTRSMSCATMRSRNA